MLSYRHGFHAGNFADVFKHILLFSLLENFKKQKPFTFIDIFSGAGVYSIEDPFMQKNKEYEMGILKLLSFKNNNDNNIHGSDIDSSSFMTMQFTYKTN